MTEPPQDPPPGQPPAGRPRPTPGPQNDEPQYGGPAYGEPQFLEPQNPGPQYGQQYGPAYGQQYGPAYGQQYGEPQYVPGYGEPQDGAGYGNGQAGHAPPGTGAPAGVRLLDRLGPRALRRPEPRFGVTLAAVGIALTVFGVVVLGTGRSTGTGISSGGHKALGIVLSLALVLAGYVVVWLRRHGPLSTAGIAASALGVPLLLILLCNAADTGSTTTTDVVAIGSLLVWVASYVAVPGAQGHVFYLGASTVTLWYFVLDKVESDFVVGLVLLPFAGLQDSADGGGFFQPSDFPDYTTIATVSLLFGVAYYFVAFLLDRSGRSGVATAFVVGGLPAVVLGLVVASADAGRTLEGVLIVAAGLVLGLAGARTGRRFTTWFWSLGVAVGVVVILADVVGSHATAAGISLILIGVAVVLVAQVAATALREPDETLPTPPRPGPQPVA